MQDSNLLEQMMVEPKLSNREKGIEPIVPRGLVNYQVGRRQEFSSTDLFPGYTNQALTNSSMTVQSLSDSIPVERTKEKGAVVVKQSVQPIIPQQFSDEAVPEERHAQSMKQIPNYRLAKSCANCAFSIYDPALGHGLCERWKAPICPSYLCDYHLDPNTLLTNQSESTPEEKYSESQVTVSTYDDRLESDSLEVGSLGAEEMVEQQGELLKEEVERIVNESKKKQNDLKYVDEDLFQRAFNSAPSFVETQLNEVLKKMYAERRYEKDFKQKYGLDQNPYRV
jgi:uncharacterized small protein (DUF1192 family)